MTDDKLNEAARDYVDTSNASSALECNECNYDDLEDCFCAGANWERERSKKLVEALKYLLRKEDLQGKFRKLQGQIILTDAEIEVAENIIKEYEGVK